MSMLPKMARRPNLDFHVEILRWSSTCFFGGFGWSSDVQFQEVDAGIHRNFGPVSEAPGARCARCCPQRMAKTYRDLQQNQRNRCVESPNRSESPIKQRKSSDMFGWCVYKISESFISIPVGGTWHHFVMLLPGDFSLGCAICRRDAFARVLAGQPLELCW